ncbi:hypothetical protein DXG01_013609 [Tephrocybe rancida]|nr:hypothetical protein DXG01_013609 [Tephrocybe rancida]
MAGAPMSVQQVYAEMLGVEDLTLEKLQVYTYLKQLGLLGHTHKAPVVLLPIAAPMACTNTPKCKRIFALAAHIILLPALGIETLLAAVRLVAASQNQPLHHDKNYGHKVPLHHPDPEKHLTTQKSSPYQISSNLYKPSTPFKRSALPLYHRDQCEDDTDAHPTGVYGPEAATRTDSPARPSTTSAPDAAPSLSTASGAPPAALSRPPVPQATKPSLMQRLFPWAFRIAPVGLVRRPHPFTALKAGRKLIVIAVVDAGSISFFRLLLELPLPTTAATPTPTLTTTTPLPPITRVIPTPRPMAPVPSAAVAAVAASRRSTPVIPGTDPASDFRLRKIVLVANPDLTQLYRNLVIGGQIAKAEFWDGREHLLLGQAAQEAQKMRKSGQLVDPRPEAVDGDALA